MVRHLVTSTTKGKVPGALLVAMSLNGCSAQISADSTSNSTSTGECAADASACSPAGGTDVLDPGTADPSPAGGEPVAAPDVVKLTSDKCIDPDLSRLASDQSLMLCDGTVAQGTLVVPVVPPPCAADGATDCIAVAAFKAADMSNVTGGNIRAGVVIAGQTGAYPSATNPLAGADATADLEIATFDAKIKDGATDFEWFDSAGNRYQRSGDSDIDESNIKSGVNIFGTGGVVSGITSADSWNLRAGVTVGAVTGKLKTNCRNGANLSVFDISIPKAATVNVDDTFTFTAAHGWSTGDSVRITYQTAPPATPAINNSTTYYVIVSSPTAVRLATSAANATLGTAVNITNIGAAVAVFRWNDGDLGSADTIEDFNFDNSAPLTQSPWVPENFCGGIAATADDSNVWLDVTTVGGVAGTCAGSPAQCRVKDKISGLEWSSTQSNSMRWGLAMDHCQNLSVDGVAGWRLPTQKEILGAYNHGIRSAANSDWISAAEIGANYFWSSTTFSNDPNGAYWASMADGTTSFSLKSTAYQVVCVR